jgi:hypothetical protein
MVSWRITSCCILILVLAGCSPRRDTRGPFLRYEMRVLSRTFGSCDSSGTPCVTVHFSYPDIFRAASEPASDSVAGYVSDQMFALLEDAERTQPFDSIASGLIEQYADLTQEFTDYRLPWTFERSCAVSLDTCGIISVRFEESSFLGGAHGLHIVRLASFDASSGRRLTYADMFRSGYESAFAGIAEKEFRLARSVPDSQSLSDAGFWVEEGKFEPSGNFCVGKEGLVLYYNPYEIAPYVMGPTEVHVSYTSLKGILRSGRPPGNF